MNSFSKIAFGAILESASTYNEKIDILAVMENETSNIQQVNYVKNLYEMTSSKAWENKEHDVDSSKGDFNKIKGSSKLLQILEIIDKINPKHPDVDVVRQAINHMNYNRKNFEESYSRDNKPGIFLYQSVAFAIYEATGILISHAVEYVRTPEQTMMKPINKNVHSGAKSIQLLETFVSLCNNGSVSSFFGFIKNNKNFTGLEIGAIGFGIVGVITVLSFAREIVYHFYYGKVKFSEYLEQQASFLDMNASIIEMEQNRDADSRRRLADKQRELATKLRRMSNKLIVNLKMARPDIDKALENDKKALSFNAISKVDNNMSSGRTSFLL